jgi:hypothetical protein
VDLRAKTVSTLVPPHYSCTVGNETVILKSPWDLVFYSPEILLIAAAGNHRIFGFFFENTKFFNVE